MVGSVAREDSLRSIRRIPLPYPARDLVGGSERNSEVTADRPPVGGVVLLDRCRA